VAGSSKGKQRCNRFCLKLQAFKWENMRELSGESSYANKEMIWIRGTGMPENWRMNSVELFNFPVGVENGQSGNCPTQNLVDAYEYKAGPNQGKTFGEVWSGNTINLSTSNPYADLDPRFAMTIVKNGDVWPAYTGKAIETFEGGQMLRQFMELLKQVITLGSCVIRTLIFRRIIHRLNDIILFFIV